MEPYAGLGKHPGRISDECVTVWLNVESFGSNPGGDDRRPESKRFENLDSRAGAKADWHDARGASSEVGLYGRNRASDDDVAPVVEALDRDIGVTADDIELGLRKLVEDPREHTPGKE